MVRNKLAWKEHCESQLGAIWVPSLKATTSKLGRNILYGIEGVVIALAPPKDTSRMISREAILMRRTLS